MAWCRCTLWMSNTVLCTFELCAHTWIRYSSANIKVQTDNFWYWLWPNIAFQVIRIHSHLETLHFDTYKFHQVPHLTWNLSHFDTIDEVALLQQVISAALQKAQDGSFACLLARLGNVPLVSKVPELLEEAVIPDEAPYEAV